MDVINIADTRGKYAYAIEKDYVQLDSMVDNTELKQTVELFEQKANSGSLVVKRYNFQAPDFNALTTEKIVYYFKHAYYLPDNQSEPIMFTLWGSDEKEPASKPYIIRLKKFWR